MWELGIGGNWELGIGEFGIALVWGRNCVHALHTLYFGYFLLHF